MLANSRSNPCITEKQLKTLDELEKKPSLSPNQKDEMARLLVLKENTGKVILSDVCVTYLMEEYAWKVEKMVRVTKELMDVPQMQKGTIVEPQSLKMLSMLDGVDYVENRAADGSRERIYNKYLSGEVDAYVGKSIMGAFKIPDIKSTWDYPTFLCKTQECITQDNDWQVKGYLDISGAPEGFIADCLVDADINTHIKLKYKLLNKMNVATEDAPEFKEKWAIIERSIQFSRIPIHKRVFKKPVEPMSDFERQRVYDRVKICREWLWKFDEMYEELNIPVTLHQNEPICTDLA